MRIRLGRSCLPFIAVGLVVLVFILARYGQDVVNVGVAVRLLFIAMAILVGLGMMIDNRPRSLRMKFGSWTTSWKLSSLSVGFIGGCVILGGLTEFVMAGLFPTEIQPCSIMIVFGGFVIATLYELLRRIVSWR